MFNLYYDIKREQAILRAIEEQKMREEKVRAQEDRRNMLDYSLKLKMKKKVFRQFHTLLGSCTQCTGKRSSRRVSHRYEDPPAIVATVR